MTALALFVFAACSSGPTTTEPVLPIGWEDAECSVCGMLVGEQPAPRGQLAWRDGTHAFTCSLSDLRAAVQGRGPRGEPVAVWVEALPDAQAPLLAHLAALPWIPAAEASYVVGFQRGGVMGHPVLAYRDPQRAAAAATAVGGQTVAWSALLNTPFNEIPKGVAP